MAEQAKSERRNQAIDDYVEEVWPQVLEDIASMVAIESVEDLEHATPGAPYGPGPRKAVDCALAIAERLGLATSDDAGHVAWAEVPGASGKILATMCHSDVVPVAGQEWSTDPFAMARRDGYLMGRGVADDKGPLVLTLWAAHFYKRLVDAGTPLPHTLRAIIGSNEETSMADADWYVEHHGSPAFLFTPDADFPVCHGEKGLFWGRFVSEPVANGKLAEFHGGTVSNAIPSRAQATVRVEADSLPQAEHITIEDMGDGLARLTAKGIGGHASMPEGTMNAIALLNAYLLEHHLYDEAQRPFLELQALLLADSYGEAIGVAATDEPFGRSTVVGGVVETEEDGRFTQTVDSRFVTTTSADAITERLSAVAAEHDCAFEQIQSSAPFYVSLDSPEIAALMEAYRVRTGRDEQPYTIGGGTYARHFAKAVAFGPEEPSDPKPDWVGEVHGPDEGISEDLLKTALGVYIDAIGRLMALDL